MFVLHLNVATRKCNRTKIKEDLRFQKEETKLSLFLVVFIENLQDSIGKLLAYLESSER